MLTKLSGFELGQEKQALFVKKAEECLSCEWGQQWLQEKGHGGALRLGPPL